MYEVKKKVKKKTHEKWRGFQASNGVVWLGLLSGYYCKPKPTRRSAVTAVTPVGLHVRGVFTEWIFFSFHLAAITRGGWGQSSEKFYATGKWPKFTHAGTVSELKFVGFEEPCASLACLICENND